MDELLFNQTYHNVKNGIKNHPFFDLIVWIKVEFKIDVYNIIYEEIRNDKMPRLNFVLRTSEDSKMFVEKVGVYENSKVSAFFKKNYSKFKNYKTENVYVITSSFENWCLTKISENAEDLKQLITEEHEDIWLIQQMYLHFIIFTQKQNQIKKFEQLGLEFQERFFVKLKSNDEFGFLDLGKIKIHFDSRENFEQKHNGSWRSYFG